MALRRGVCLLIMTLGRCPSIQSLVSVCTLSDLGHSIVKGVLEVLYTEVFFLLFKGKGLVWIAVKHFVFFISSLERETGY